LRASASALLLGARAYLEVPGKWRKGTVGVRDSERCMAGAIFQADDEEACLSSPEGKLAFCALPDAGPGSRRDTLDVPAVGSIRGPVCAITAANDRPDTTLSDVLRIDTTSTQR